MQNDEVTGKGNNKLQEQNITTKQRKVFWKHHNTSIYTHSTKPSVVSTV